MSLTTEQQQCAVEVMNLYLSAPKGEDGLTPVERSETLDKNRASLIEAELLPLLHAYLSGKTTFEEFKSKNDSLNKRNEYWGFKGIKGQMFFNLLVNCASNVDECDQEIKAAIAVPSSEELAKSRIKNFSSYVRRVGEEYVEGGGSKHGRPKLGVNNRT
jgi:hypothetical protein